MPRQLSDDPGLYWDKRKMKGKDDKKVWGKIKGQLLTAGRALQVAG